MPAKQIVTEQPQLQYTVNVQPFQKVLSEVDLNLMTILEFGIGNGDLTNLILQRNPRIVLGYEINPNLIMPEHEKLIINFKDFTEENFKWLRNGKCGVICIPPQKKLEDVKEIIEQNNIDHAIITVPKSKKKLFPEFEVVEELKGTDFTPERRGVHLVLRKGFA